jgi:hypothetical protein
MSWRRDLGATMRAETIMPQLSSVLALTVTAWASSVWAQPATADPQPVQPAAEALEVEPTPQPPTAPARGEAPPAADAGSPADTAPTAPEAEASAQPTEPAAPQPPATSPLPEPATAAVEPPTAEAEADAEADADADAALDELTEEETFEDAAPLPIEVYGFADLGYRQVLVERSSPWLLSFNRHPSFFIGNLNLYFDKQLTPDWRSLAEVRLTYLPHGARRVSWVDGSITRIDNRSSDYLDAQRNRQVGGVILEQVWLQYTAHPLLTMRAGQWLSPYGVWVTDHGSPVIIGVRRPIIIGSELIPEHQVGLLFKGGSLLAGSLEWSYALGLSNGRSTLVAYEDLDGNKALTAHVALLLSALGDLQVGASAYYGRYTESSEQATMGPDGLESEEAISLQMDELVYAADLRWVYEGLHVQGEIMSYERRFTEAGRPPDPTGGLTADRRKWGGYALLGYRLPWFPLMPYGKVEYAPDNTAEVYGIPDQVVIWTGGLNYRPIPYVVLKGEFTRGYFTETEGDTTGLTKHGINMLEFQLAWAF